MKGKGFTLIELLAVIVILAIVAIIAVPSVINVIEDARKGSFKNSVYGIIKAAEYNHALKTIKDSNPGEIKYTYENRAESSIPAGYKLEYKGEKPKDGTIVINEEGQVSLALHDGTYCAEKRYEDKEVTISEKDKEECDVSIPQYVDKSRANAPQLITGMTPVIWNGNDWVEPSNINDPYEQDWYDYANQKWANAKTEDGSFWVWIPRYAYSITSGYHTSTAGTIDIKFLNGITNTTNDGTKIETSGYETGVKDTSMHYFKHPAFTFGNDEIEGFWVAKYASSVADQNDACYTSESTDNCNKDTITPKYIPNATIFRYIDISNMFAISENMKNQTDVYGWNADEVDTHMMKNSEWGAVAYLSKSKYGAHTEEVWINSFSGYRTGCSGTSVSASSSSTCIEYHTENGVKASTTHNIYGVYDMSGGARERTSAYLDNGKSILTTRGANIINAGSKYKTIYSMGATDTEANNYEANKNVYGDGVYETSSTGKNSTSWFGADSYMPSTLTPFFARGGSCNAGARAGVLGFNDDNGASLSGYSWRVSVVAKSS